MNANELADKLEKCCLVSWGECNHEDYDTDIWTKMKSATMLRQQQNEIEDLKSANRFIQNFAEEQHQRAVALEMRELTDEEIRHIQAQCHHKDVGYDGFIMRFARAILRKASEK